MFSVMMSDNVKARIMLSDGSYVHASCQETEAPLNAQEFFYDDAYKKAAAKKQRQEKTRESREKSTAKKSVAKKTKAKNRRKV